RFYRHQPGTTTTVRAIDRRWWGRLRRFLDLAFRASSGRLRTQIPGSARSLEATLASSKKVAHGGFGSRGKTGPRPRFRRAVRAAHRAPGAGAACLRADRPARYRGGAGAGAGSAGRDPLRRPGERVRAGGAPLRPRDLRGGRADTRDLLRDAVDLRG